MSDNEKLWAAGSLVIINIMFLIVTYILFLSYENSIKKEAVPQVPSSIYTKSQNRIIELEKELGVLNYKLIECKKEKIEPRPLVVIPQ